MLYYQLSNKLACCVNSLSAKLQLLFLNSIVASHSQQYLLAWSSDGHTGFTHGCKFAIIIALLHNVQKNIAIVRDCDPSSGSL